MWGTDMTSTVTVGEGATCVFVAVDHCTTECIGLHAAKRGTRFEALEPIRQGVRERFGPISDGVARGLRLRHDHGSNYLADDFQQEVAFFGAFHRLRVPRACARARRLIVAERDASRTAHGRDESMRRRNRGEPTSALRP